MKVIKSSIPEVMIMEPREDEFVYKSVNKTYSLLPMLKNGVDIRFCSEGETRVKHSGTLCGIYYETGHDVQSKMIRCVSGEIILCVVDLNYKGNTLGRTLLIKVDDENKRQVYVPKGYGFGFLTMTDDVFIQYKFEQNCAGEKWSVFNAFSEELEIKWPLPSQLTMAACEKYAPVFSVAVQNIMEKERLLNSNELIVEGEIATEEYEDEK